MIMHRPRFARSKRGASISQYALIVGLVAIVALLATTALGVNIRTIFTNTGTAIGGISGTGSGGSGGGSGASFTGTFTPCGATGANGPSQTQCNTAYGPGVVTVTGGIQFWTVPNTGNYHITAAGAAGGAMTSYTAGSGVTLTGDFALTAGQVLKILPGQRGIGISNQPALDGAGGGGGSFVTTSTNVPLIIAGGGGGAGSYGNGKAANTGVNGVDGDEIPNCCGQGYPGLGGTVTAGGNNGSAQAPGSGGGANPGTTGSDGVYGGLPGGGGAGLGGDSGIGGNGGTRAQAFINGGTGGYAPSIYGGIADAYGGFGGGGAAGSAFQVYNSGGGGGGGYTGGGGGGSLGAANKINGGGGGGSYNNGSNPVIGPANTGNGSVTITQF